MSNCFVSGHWKSFSFEWRAADKEWTSKNSISFVSIAQISIKREFDIVRLTKFAYSIDFESFKPQKFIK